MLTPTTVPILRFAQDDVYHRRRLYYVNVYVRLLSSTP
jgi:hypothetical protein